MHYYIKRNRTQYSIANIFCFLKGKKTNANNNTKKLKLHLLQKKSIFYFSFIFSIFKREWHSCLCVCVCVCVCACVFYTCLQGYRKFSLKSKIQEEFSPLYLNALIRNREYHITFFYHNTWSKPMFFHISTVFVSGSICGKLTPHCPWQNPFYRFKMKASTMTSYSLNLIDLSQSCNQRILEASKAFKISRINFYFLSGLLPLSARKMQLCSVSPSSPFPTLWP